MRWSSPRSSSTDCPLAGPLSHTSQIGGDRANPADASVSPSHASGSDCFERELNTETESPPSSHSHMLEHTSRAADRHSASMMSASLRASSLCESLFNSLFCDGATRRNMRATPAIHTSYTLNRFLHYEYTAHKKQLEKLLGRVAVGHILSLFKTTDPLR